MTKERDELRERNHTSPELQRLNYIHESPEQRPHTSRPSGERSRLLMASLYQRQRMKQSFSSRSLPHHRKTLPTNTTNSLPHQSWASLFFTRDSVCVKGSKKEVIGNGTDIHHSRAFRPDLLSIFHLKNLGPRATEYLTALFNDSFKSSRKTHHRKVCVAVDLTAAFDTVCHSTLISKIARSTLPSSTTRWLSCYLLDRQSRTSCRGVKSSARIVHAGVPQGSKLSPSLFSFYLADMPKPTESIRRVCYADGITVWASGVQIPVLEQRINSYLEEMSTFLKVNSLLISTPKSTVTLFTPDPFQVRIHSKIAIADAILPQERTPKILGVLLDTSFAFHHHCKNVAKRVSKRNNILKALAGTSWRQQKETC